MTHKGLSQVLAYDLGGTKVAAGIVTPKGEVIEEIRMPVKMALGKNIVLKQLVEIGKDLLGKYPRVKKIGIASAGPLDPIKGLLLDPSNFKDKNNKTWGKVPISSYIEKNLRRKTYIENDAAAAILAEHWIGAAKNYQNAMILTLGTGLGTGIVANGKLVRAGRNLHTEAGLMIINGDDESAVCGTGNFGSAEAYLSGRNFERRFNTKYGKNLSGHAIAELAKQGDFAAKEAFREYSYYFAIAVYNYVMLFAPEVIILTGSFAAASQLFLKDSQTELKKLLARRRKGVDLLPKIIISRLHNQASLIGGALTALRGA